MPTTPEQALQHGELTVIGRIRSASNATFLCEAQMGDRVQHCVYKPVRGEAPLWDFPDGTLAGRELCSYLVSAALGWNIVPYTTIRDGPAGPGMVQRWVDQPADVCDVSDVSDVSDVPDVPDNADDSNIDRAAGDVGPDLIDLLPSDRIPAGFLPVLQAYDYAGDEVTLVHADDDRLRRVAVFDILINNADRKGGHVLLGVDGRVYGVDHGVSLHVEDKLRTVLWGWAGKPIDDDTLAAVDRLGDLLGDQLGELLRSHITRAEVAALRSRVLALLRNPVMPTPDRRRPIPWPAF